MSVIALLDAVKAVVPPGSYVAVTWHEGAVDQALYRVMVHVYLDPYPNAAPSVTCEWMVTMTELRSAKFDLLTSIRVNLIAKLLVTLRAQLATKPEDALCN